MKKYLFLSFVLVSCSENITNDYSIKDTVLQANVDTFQVTDSVMYKVNDLIKSTENSEKKVSEIKSMKNENTCLKKELIETKQDLYEANEYIKKIEDTLSAVKSESKKKGFIRRVIDNIKNDTLQ